MSKWEKLSEEAFVRKDEKGSSKIQVSGRDRSGKRRGLIGRAPGGLKEN